MKDYYNSKIEEYNQIKSLLKNPKNLPESVSSLSNENLSLRKEIDTLTNEKVVQIKNTIVKNLKSYSGINIYSSLIQLKQSKIKDLCFSVGAEINNLFLIVISEENNKVFCSCFISKNLVSEKNLNASDVVTKLGELINGKGGGQPFYATCAGNNNSDLNKLISSAEDIQKQLIS